MKSLRIGVAIAFAALVMAAVAAGPAVASNGNSDAAHACQHDGWKTMIDPATGQPFKNQGDCVSSATHRRTRVARGHTHGERGRARLG